MRRAALGFRELGSLGDSQRRVGPLDFNKFWLGLQQSAVNPGQSMSHVMCPGNERTAYRWRFESEPAPLVSFRNFLLNPLFLRALAPSILFFFLGAALRALRPLLRAGCS